MSMLLKIVVGAGFAAAGVLAAPDETWAKGKGGAHSGGHRSGAHSGHRHGVPFARGGLFLAIPYSYYYPPLWSGIDPSAPVVYVEQFPGIPGADTQDTIYCPERAAAYPYVTECPGGWQRILSKEEAAGASSTP
jgi:hypothetical protein